MMKIALSSSKKVPKICSKMYFKTVQKEYQKNPSLMINLKKAFFKEAQ